MKECPGCGETKSLESFWVNAAKPDGRFRRCADCENRIQNERREAMRAVIVAAKATPCVDCDRSYPPVVMEFDHRGDEQKIARIADWPRRVGRSAKAIARLEAEIAKCDVVCANCHRIRHADELEGEWRGSRSSVLPERP